MPGNEISSTVAVLLPVYNGMQFLTASIYSVLQQENVYFELLILDDASTDGSWQFIQNIKDSRVRVFKNEQNLGLFPSLNFLLKQANNTLIKLWAQDDIMLPHCLSTVVAFHKKFPESAFSFTGRQIIDQNGQITMNKIVEGAARLVSTFEHTRVAFFTGSIAGNIANVCISKKCLSQVGPFNETMKISADFDMLVRLAKDNPIGFIPQNLIQQREHTGQLSQNSFYNFNHVKEDLQVYRNLISYTCAEEVQAGIKVMRRHKLVFYYTLMIKTFLKGKLKQAVAYYKELAAFDNFWLLSISFLRVKLFKLSKLKRGER